MIDGEQISEADFAGLAAQDASVMQQALQGTFGSLTHFEVLTSLAFRHFQRKQVNMQHSRLLLFPHACTWFLQSGQKSVQLWQVLHSLQPSSAPFGCKATVSVVDAYQHLRCYY